MLWRSSATVSSYFRLSNSRLTCYLGNREEGEALRCQLVRALRGEMRDAVQSHARASRIALRVLESYIVPFCDAQESTSRLHEGLTPIIEQLLQLGWQVWTRKARLEVFGLPGLAKGPPIGAHIGNVQYKSTSDKLELHAMHGKEVDDDACALDSKDVLLLCTPVVVMAGNAEGKEYDKQRVVKRGVVWLG